MRISAPELGRKSPSDKPQVLRKTGCLRSDLDLALLKTKHAREGKLAKPAVFAEIRA